MTQDKSKQKKKIISTSVKTNRLKIWIGFALIHSLISIIIGFGAYVLFGLLVAFVVFGITFIFGWLFIVFKAWTQIEEKSEYILEIFGAYIGYPLKSGLQFIFPYFDFMFVRSIVYTGTQYIPLFLAGEDKGDERTGAVDFEDDSAPVAADVFFRIVDSAKATYEIDDVFSGITKKISAALRAYLGNYLIDDAILLKTHFDLPTIMNGTLVSRERDGSINSIGLIHSEHREKIKTIEKEIKAWGIKIESIVITDILLSEETQKLRRKVLDAKKESEAATHTGEKIIKLAGAQKTADMDLGEGLGNKLNFIVQKGHVSPSEASDLLKKLELYSNIGDNAVIVDSGSSGKNTPLEGARFGAGFGKASDSIVTNKKNDEV